MIRANYTHDMLTGPLEEALATLGATLDERGQAVGVLVIGGSSLLLLGVIDRPTADGTCAHSRLTTGTSRSTNYRSSLPRQHMTWELRLDWANDGSTVGQQA